MIQSQPTPFGTVHLTSTGDAGKESHLKSAMTRHAKSHGWLQLSRRSHIIGDQVTVFGIYQKGH